MIQFTSRLRPRAGALILLAALVAANAIPPGPAHAQGAIDSASASASLQMSPRPLPRGGREGSADDALLRETIDSLVIFGQTRPRWRQDAPAGQPLGAAPSRAAVPEAPATLTAPAPRIEAALAEAMVTAIGDAKALSPATGVEPTADGDVGGDVATRARNVSLAAVSRSARPRGRPSDLITMQPRKVGTFGRKDQGMGVATGLSGAICGDGAIRGKKIPAIPGRLRGCGIQNPVAVTAVDGVILSSVAKMDCTTAKALKNWVRTGVKPAVGRTGGGVASLKVAAHYSCRTRNNKRGAKISEHGKGRAIDISEVRLKDGSTLSVLKGWRKASTGRLLKQIHRAACGPFGTVLGPAADRYHQDHFHLDTARYRSGSYCR